MPSHRTSTHTVSESVTRTATKQASRARQTRGHVLRVRGLASWFAQCELVIDQMSIPCPRNLNGLSELIGRFSRFGTLWQDVDFIDVMPFFLPSLPRAAGWLWSDVIFVR